MVLEQVLLERLIISELNPHIPVIMMTPLECGFCVSLQSNWLPMVREQPITDSIRVLQTMPYEITAQPASNYYQF